MRFPPNRLLPILLLALLAGCAKPPPKPAAQAAFVPPAPSAPSLTAPICARPDEQAAFAATALKSQLMVTAINCHARTRYDAFITRYRPELAQDDLVLKAFFIRAYGAARGQREYDRYITQLANDQSDLGVQSGVEFCHFNVGLFDQVLGQQQSLADFAQGKPIQQALDVRLCAATPPKAKK